MSQPQRLGDTLSFRALQSQARARSVRGMTTNSDTDRVTQLIGNMVATHVNRVPDDQVILSLKEELHAYLEDGAMFDRPVTINERHLLELMTLLGFTERSDVWAVEQAIHQLIDSYDLFND